MAVVEQYLETEPQQGYIELDPRVVDLQNPDASSSIREAASESIVTEFRPPVFRCADRILHSPSDAEDVAQDTFIRAFGSINTYRPKPHHTFGHWLLRIAHNRAIDVYKYNKRRSGTVSIEEDHFSDFNLPDETQKSPETAYEDTIRSEKMGEKLKQITPVFAASLVLRYVEDLEYETIAERQHVPVGTVRSRIHRGKKELKQVILSGR